LPASASHPFPEEVSLRTLLLLSAVSLFIILPAPTTADVITVDGGGGGDYLTIQEAVDAAAAGDTVLVYPGTYTDIHDSELYGYPVNVDIYQRLTLKSLSGPDVTVIEGGGLTVFGILSDWGSDVVIEGFTVTDAGWFEWWGAAICVTDGEVRGNVCTGSYMGITDNPWWYAGSASEDSEVRSRGLLVADNTLEGNEAGINVRYGDVVTDNTVEGNVAGICVGGDAVVSGNSVSGGQIGIAVHDPRGMSLVGNDISGNTKGIRIRNPSHNAGAHYSIDLQANRIVDNTEMNIDIGMWDVDPGSRCRVTLGGSLDGVNDIYGAPINLHAAAHNVDLYLDATYNFWGSVACSTFVPYFDIGDGVSDTAFIFEPFVDQTHTTVYENCEGVPVEQQSWGSIKSLYR
jgi:hypothetical protein